MKRNSRTQHAVEKTKNTIRVTSNS